jgi:ABC-type transport system involved in multi-copper enzyme maturation permease subunit
MRNFLTLVHLTFLELRRRRILLAALACGAACLLVFALAVYLIHNVHHAAHPSSLLQSRMQLQLQALAGLYVVNLMSVTVAVMLPVDTLAGEVASGVMQTLLARPVYRWEVVLAKWLVFWLTIAAYTAMMAVGVALVMRLFAGFVQVNLPAAVGLITLEATVLLSVIFVGGARITTVANGMVAFAFYAIAVVGGWIEQIGVIMGDSSARYIGTAVSLVSPTDALWRRAAYLLQPPVMSQVQLNPFAPASLPSVAMVWWAAAFAAAALVVAVLSFERRPL